MDDINLNSRVEVLSSRWDGYTGTVVGFSAKGKPLVMLDGYDPYVEDLETGDLIQIPFEESPPMRFEFKDLKRIEDAN